MTDDLPIHETITAFEIQSHLEAQKEDDSIVDYFPFIDNIDTDNQATFFVVEHHGDDQIEKNFRVSLDSKRHVQTSKDQYLMVGWLHVDTIPIIEAMLEDAFDYDEPLMISYYETGEELGPRLVKIVVTFESMKLFGSKMQFVTSGKSNRNGRLAV